MEELCSCGKKLFFKHTVFEIFFSCANGDIDLKVGFMSLELMGKVRFGSLSCINILFLIAVTFS